MTSRCRVVISLGITRSFPRLCPPAGLVTVALLTLAPLALRPVRLACLIHAANVHSEPGSNPSKVALTGPHAQARDGSSPSAGLRNLTGRTGASRRDSAAHPAAGSERPPLPPD